MFELTISTTADKQFYIDDFYHKLISVVKKDLGIVIKQNYHGRSYLTMAIKDAQKDYFKALVLDYIVFMISDDYKLSFFKENLMLSGTNVIHESFLKAITVFDSELDKEIIKEEIELAGEILVDSLYYFKLESLRLRWGRTVEIINQNRILQSQPSMLEVISYLTATSENKAVVTDILIGKKQIKLKHFKGSKIYKRTFEGVSNFFTEIVRLNPTKINLKLLSNSGKAEDVTEILNKIFCDKIYLINWFKKYWQ